MKKTTVDMSSPTIVVKVEESDGVILTQNIKPQMVDAVMADLGVSREVARKFLIEFVGASLRNATDPDAAESEFLGRLMEAVTQNDNWAVDCIGVFAKKFLPEVEKVVAEAKKSGQDPATAISVAISVPMQAARSFAACVELMEGGLNGDQITEVLVSGMRGEDVNSIAERFGITDDKLKKS